MQLDANISQVEVTGFSDHQLRIEVTASALRRYGLSISDIKELVVTDTIPLPENKKVDKIKQLSVASLLGEAIKRIHNEETVSALFE